MQEQTNEIVQFPQLNKPAPHFKARTTHGTVELSDYKGKWLVLFSHPADFTPVCTTEFMAFAKHYDEFQAEGADLLGLSIDSYYSHVAWVRNIKEKFGVDIQFPIIEDLSMNVAKAYGMIPKPDLKPAVRNSDVYLNRRDVCLAEAKVMYEKAQLFEERQRR